LPVQLLASSNGLLNILFIQALPNPGLEPPGIMVSGSVGMCHVFEVISSSN
jgi:hypothetical protein